jgi:O-antigen/teichoic acid export membrane protein
MIRLRQITSEPRGFLGRTAWLTVARGVSLALSFLLPLLLVRLLPQEEFGLYKQAFQILSTALSLLGFQVATSVYYFLPREPDKKLQVVLNVVIFYFILGAGVALFFGLRPGWITIIFSGDHLVPVMPLLGLATMLWLVSSAIEGVMIAEQDVRLSAVYTLIFQFGKTALLIGAALVFGDIYALVVAAVIQGVLQCALFAIYLRYRYGRMWAPFEAGLFAAQVKSSVPFGFGSVGLIVLYDLHNYFVSHYFDPAAFAVYAIAGFHLPLLLVLLDSVEMVLSPEVGRLAHEQAWGRVVELWMNTIRLLALVFIPAGVLLFVLRTEFITTLFTKNYLAAETIFALNLLSLPLWIWLSGPVLRSFTDMRFFRLKLYLILVPVMWAALYAGIRAYGLIGAAAAVLIVRALDNLITITVTGKRVGMTWRDLRRLLPLLKIGVAATMAGLVIAGMKLLLAPLPTVLLLAICAVVFGLVYLVAVFAAGGVTDEEKTLLREKLARFFRDRAALVSAD